MLYIRCALVAPSPNCHMTIASCKGNWEIVFILKSWILFLKEKVRPDIGGQLVILAVVSQSLDSFLPQFFFLCLCRDDLFNQNEIIFYVFCNLFFSSPPLGIYQYSLSIPLIGLVKNHF